MGSPHKDPRAHILENDPFQTSSNSIPSIRVIYQTSTSIPTSPRLWHFSKTELQHLSMASIGFTLALGFMSVGGILTLPSYGIGYWLLLLLQMTPLMAIAVGPAFILHEIGHKLIARKNGCWAEFRADPRGIQQGVFISLLFGIVFMAPGAVMVAGNVNRRQNGHIAIAGPITNAMLVVFGIIMGSILLGLFGDTFIIHTILFAWLWSNTILGLFNMIPFGPLDGLKVKQWSEFAFYTMIVIFCIPILSVLSNGPGLFDITLMLSELIF